MNNTEREENAETELAQPGLELLGPFDVALGMHNISARIKARFRELVDNLNAHRADYPLPSEFPFFCMMRVIAQTPGITSQNLRNRVVTSNSTYAVKKLTEDGFIRQGDADETSGDRRKKPLFLTDKGEEAVRIISTQILGRFVRELSIAFAHSVFKDGGEDLVIDVGHLKHTGKPLGEAVRLGGPGLNGKS